MTGDVAVSLVLLAAAGLLPALALVGVRPVVVVLAPLAGAVVAAVAAVSSLVVAGGLIPWFVLWAAAAAGVAVGWWWVRPGRRPDRTTWSWWSALWLVPVVAATAWSVRSLRLVTIGFDARGLWLLHGAWFAGGHHVARAAISDPVLAFAHPNYPPLVGAAVAVGWAVTGAAPGSAAALRDGQIVVGVLNACALVAVGSVFVEVTVARRRAVDGDGALGVVPGLASLVGALVCVALAAGAGPYLVDGYADPLWVLAAVGAVAFGLVLPLSGPTLGTAALLVAVAGLTKLEGILTGEVLVVLVALRYGLGDGGEDGVDGARGRWTRAAAGGVAGCLALAVWPVVARLLHADPDDDASGHRYGTVGARWHASVSAMVPHLHVVPVAAVVALVGSLTLRRVRGTGSPGGLAGDVWLWTVLVWNLVAIAGTYALGTAPITVWLATSVDRTTTFAPGLALVSVGVWVVLGLVQLLDTEPSGPVDPGVGTGPPVSLDADAPDVLHHGA